MIRINWQVFDENSSERDSIYLFSIGKISLKTLCQQIWNKNSKIELIKLKKHKTQKARQLAKKWIYRNYSFR